MSTFLPWLLCLLVGLLLHCSPCLSDTHLRLTNTKHLPKYERVIMVLDSPKSILPEEWARDVLKWATNVALGLPADVEVAVWLCGKHTVIEQPFTLDRELLQTKIKSAKYQQGANLTDAFALATEVFRGDDRSGALILVTDGAQEDIDKVIAVQPPVPTFVAGMGSSVKLDNIKLLASSPDLGFIHPDVRLIVNHVKQTTNYNVLIKDITLLDTDKIYTELKDITHLTIRVTLLNLMAKDDIPEGTVIWFRSPLTDTVHPKRVTIETPIKPDETRFLEVKLDVKSLTSILELPCSLSFEFNTDTAKRHIPLVARHDSFQLATSFLQGLFRGWKYQEWPQSFGRDNTYRIVLFGGIGAGKSTLVNHITFALNDHYTSSPDVADACSKPGHCSTRVSTYQLTMQLLGQLFQLPIKLKDMWGVDDKNMLGDTIDMVFQGHADGRSMSDTLHRTGNERSGEEADCLLLTASIHGTSVEVLNRMKEAIKLALERGMAVLLAITYADEVDEALHEERRQSLANQFGLTLEKVIFTGYQRNGSRSCEVDRSTLHLLHRSLQAIGQSRKNLLEKYRADCQAKGNATCVAEVNRILNVADTPNVTSSTPLWSAGLCLVALAAAVAVFWSRNRGGGGGNDGPQADERKKAKKDKKDKRKKKLREEGAALLGRKTSETGDEEEKKKEKRAEKEEKEAVKAEKLEPDEAAREEAPQRNQPAQTAQE